MRHTGPQAHSSHRRSRSASTRFCSVVKRHDILTRTRWYPCMRFKGSERTRFPLQERTCSGLGNKCFVSTLEYETETLAQSTKGAKAITIPENVTYSNPLHVCATPDINIKLAMDSWSPDSLPKHARFQAVNSSTSPQDCCCALHRNYLIRTARSLT